MVVLKNCGMKMEFDEVYEDCQRIYDKTMEMQGEKINYMYIIDENDACAMYFTGLKEKNICVKSIIDFVKYFAKCRFVQ